MVEAVRIGTVIAHDRKAHTRWQRHRDKVAPKRALSDAALEQAVMRVGAMFPGNVTMGTA